MRTWRNLPLEKKNTLFILITLFVGFLIASFTLRSHCSRPSPVVKLWEREHGEMGWWHEIAFSPDGRYVISASSQMARVWRAKDGKLVRSFSLAAKQAAITISPNGQWLATYEKNGTVRVWKLPEGKLARTLKGEKGNIMLLTFSHNGKFIAAASHDLGVVKVWQTESGELVRSLSLGANRVRSVAISPNGKTLAAEVLYYRPNRPIGDLLRLWDLSTGKTLYSAQMKIVPSKVNAFSFSPDGKFLVVMGSGAIAAWKIEGKKANHQIALQGAPMAMGFHPRDSSLIFVHEDISRDILTPFRPRCTTVPAFWVYGDVLTCWRLTERGLEKCWETKNLVSGTLTFNDPVSALALSPDGQLMGVVTWGSRVKLFRFEEISLGK